MRLASRPARRPAPCRAFRRRPLRILARFAETLERVCIATVESGHLTKDLALLVGADQPRLSTTGFLDKVDENLRKAMG